MSAATYSLVVGKGKGNPCHVKSGPAGGQFCETGGGSNKIRYRVAGAWGRTKLETAPRYLYHGTNSTALDSILNEGLLPRKHTRGFRRVFVTANLEAAQAGAEIRSERFGGKPVILRIDTYSPSMNNMVFLGDPNGVRGMGTRSRIPAEAISYIPDVQKLISKSIIVKKTFYSLPVGRHLHTVSKATPERNAVIDAADSMRTRVSTALLRTVEAVKDGISLKDLAEKLQVADLNGVLQILDLDKRFQAAAKGAGLQPNETSFLEAIKDTWAAGARAELDSLNMVPVHKGRGNPCHKPGGTSEGGQFCETGRDLKLGRPVTVTDMYGEKVTVRVAASTTPPPPLRTGGYGNIEFKAFYKDGRYQSAKLETGGYLDHAGLGRALGLKGEGDAVDKGHIRVQGDRDSVSLTFDPNSTKSVRFAEQILKDTHPENLFLDLVWRDSKGRKNTASASVRQNRGEGPPEKVVARLAREAIGKSWSVEDELVSKASIPDTIGLALSFDLLNPETIAWLSSYVMTLIQQVSDETRRAIADVVMNAFQYGGHPYEQARTIKSMIGLTQSQSQAVANFRRMLENEPLAALTRDLRDHRFDATLKQVGQMKGQLSKEQIDKMADAYYRKYLRYRSEAIARTETLRAARMGQETTWRQAIAQGLLPQDMKRKWVVAYDERLCKLCRSIPKLNPDGRGMDEQFLYSAGAAMGTTDGPPLHVHCRCSLAKKVDWNA